MIFNPIQDVNQIVISKTDLPGLTPSTSNTAESLFAGLILLWSNSFPVFLTSPLGDNIVSPDGDSLISSFPFFRVFYWRMIKDEGKLAYQFVVNIEKISD